MSTRALMTACSFCFGALGLGLLFAPVELAPLVGLPVGEEVVVQLFSAGLLAVAILDWSGRGAIYGGIYGRPIILANLMFGMVAGGSLVSARMDGVGGIAAWVLGGVFVLYVLAFARMLFVPPRRHQTPAADNTSETR